MVHRHRMHSVSSYGRPTRVDELPDWITPRNFCIVILTHKCCCTGLIDVLLDIGITGQKQPRHLQVVENKILHPGHPHVQASVQPGPDASPNSHV